METNHKTTFSLKGKHINCCSCDIQIGGLLESKVSSNVPVQYCHRCKDTFDEGIHILTPPDNIIVNKTAPRDITTLKRQKNSDSGLDLMYDELSCSLESHVEVDRFSLSSQEGLCFSRRGSGSSESGHESDDHDLYSTVICRCASCGNSVPPSSFQSEDNHKPQDIDDLREKSTEPASGEIIQTYANCDYSVYIKQEDTEPNQIFTTKNSFCNLNKEKRGLEELKEIHEDQGNEEIGMKQTESELYISNNNKISYNRGIPQITIEHVSSAKQLCGSGHFGGSIVYQNRSNQNSTSSQSQFLQVPSQGPLSVNCSACTCVHYKTHVNSSTCVLHNARVKNRTKHETEFREEKASFVLHEVVGIGVSSIVRRCVEKQTGKEYAVKIIDISGEKQQAYQSDQIKQDTLREINILKMCLGHKHIISLHDSFETPTFIFLVFEICKKGELFDYLTQVVTLSEKRTRIIMRQLLEAVDFIHSKNIVHRDLKPENILLDEHLNVKLSDFGFAVVLEEGEELTELCGTPGYLAPEVLEVSMYENVKGYGKEVDMWAFGVILYTLLCGAPPFWHRKQMQMLRMIMQANYSFGSPEWDDISQTPKDLISSLLVVDPKKRLTAAQALQHPFFRKELKPEKLFNAKRAFKSYVLCVNFFFRLRYYKVHPLPILGETVSTNPYSIKSLRKQIDACAFRMYSHWVKKGDNQNRAALFEHSPRNNWQKSPSLTEMFS